VWNWYEKIGSGAYSPLSPGSGNTNPKYFTNQLEEDTWYKVKKINGTCPEDEVELLVDIHDGLEIVEFAAIEDDSCSPSAVNLSLFFDSDCGSFNVEWYKDGTLIGITNPGSSPANFNFFVPPFDGNYYAIVEDACCHRRIKSEVIVLNEPCFALIEAPCFRCNDETVALTGHVFGLSPGVNCTYQWYKNGNPIPGGDDQTIFVDEGDVVYTFTADCGCLKSVDYYLQQCGEPLACECSSLLADVSAGFDYLDLGMSGLRFKPAAPLANCNEIIWDWGDGSPPDTTFGADSIIHNFPGIGAYNVCMNVTRHPSNAPACTEQHCNDVTLTGTGIVRRNFSIQIYPNPTNGMFSLYFTGTVPQNGSLQVVNGEGKTVFERRLIPQKWQYPVTIAALPPGVYFVKIINDGVPVWVEKVVKQ
jgi:hypothetical protein